MITNENEVAARHASSARGRTEASILWPIDRLPSSNMLRVELDSYNLSLPGLASLYYPIPAGTQKMHHAENAGIMEDSRYEF